MSQPPPEPPYDVSDGRPRTATLEIPRIGLAGLEVVPYRGFTDDAPGTEIQNNGRAASPFGPRGGVGPGGIGNYQVTAHRTSSTRAFEFLPELRPGDRVFLVAGGVRNTYRITLTRETSFRSEQSLREQRAAVPGFPGREPGPRPDHVVDLRDPGGPRRGQLLVRRVRQPRAPDRQDRRTGRVTVAGVLSLD
ncbi:MAG: sortase [Nocardioides sp.]